MLVYWALLPCAAVVSFYCWTCGESQRSLWEDLSTINFSLDFHQVWKGISGNSSTGLFPELTLEELVFLCHEYYFIFLLQQEACAL
jgi:hypothetical protein